MKKKILSIVILGCMLISYCYPIFAYNTDSSKDEKFDTDNASSQNDVKVKGINSFGTLLASELSNQIEDKKINLGFNIQNVEINGTKATVYYTAKTEANIIVGIYNDEGTKLIATGNKEVSYYDKKDNITINIEQMPEYFFIKAFIVDENLNPLSKAYESPKYTKYMKELQEMKTDDFMPEKVLNLDNDNTTNFAIYGNNTIVIEELGSTNTLKSVDQEKQIYVFENIDSKMKSLKKGNKISYQFKDGNVILINVGSISINGTTATITGSNSKMQDFFDYVKIEVSPTEDDYKMEKIENENIKYTNVNNTGKGYQLKKLSNDINKKNEYTISLNLEGKAINLGAKSGSTEISEDVTMEGSLEAKIGMEILCYVNKQNQYIEYNQSTALTFSVSISGNLEIKIPLVQGLKVNTLNIVEIDFTPYARFDVSASVEFSQEVEEEISIIFNNGSFTYNHTKPTYNPTSKVSKKVKVFAGIECSPTIKVTEFIVLKCTNKVGVNIETKEIKTDEEHIHTCKNCICGEIFISNNIDPSFTLFGLEFKDTNQLKIKITDFYYNATDGFRLSSCPNITYRVTAIAKQFDGKVVDGAVIRGTYLDSNPVTDESGKVEFFLPNGKYSLKAKSGAGEIVQSVVVEGKPVYVEFVTDSGYDEKLQCHYGILDESDARWEFYEKTGKLFILGYGDMPFEGTANQWTVPEYMVVARKDGEDGGAIKEVIVGDRITGISPNAFRDLKNLERVTIQGNSLIYIGFGAFSDSGNEKLTKIKIPETVKDIGAGAFSGCHYLQEINIPKGIKQIKDSTFYRLQ